MLELPVMANTVIIVIHWLHDAEESLLAVEIPLEFLMTKSDRFWISVDLYT